VDLAGIHREVDALEDFGVVLRDLTCRFLISSKAVIVASFRDFSSVRTAPDPD
jgi:hypothetical protein